MTLDRAVETYFAAWATHAPEDVARALGSAGTYTDPVSGGPHQGGAAAMAARRLIDAVPDLTFERVAVMATEGGQSVEWRLRGTHTGPFLAGAQPTGRSVDLGGVTLFTAVANGVTARSYFDQQELARQMGLMTLVQPVAQGPATFGYSMRVSSGNPRPPGVIALTWIAARDDAERDRIRGHSRAIVQNFLEEPGFIGIVTGFTGLRGFTVTAWEDEAAMTRGLARRHAAARRELRTEDFVPAVWTSVWSPLRINRIWTRCTACASLEDVSDDHRACGTCGVTLPERPPFW